MAEIQFYAVRDEALEILRIISETHSLKLVPEIRILEKPQVPTFDRVTPDLVSLLEIYDVVELEGAFTRFPLHFGQRAEGTARGTYYVDHGVGPRLRMFLPGMRANEVMPGSLIMIKQYRNPETNAFEAPSEDLKAAFKAITATMKKHLVKVSVRRGDSAWIGPRTKAEIDAGTVKFDR